MPAIAAGARRDGARFYWHLGDLRAIYRVDADYAQENRFRHFSPRPSLNDYLHTAWDDFLQHQVTPFGEMPFFLGIGNHELAPPKTRDQYRVTFATLLDNAQLHGQRAQDATGHAIPTTEPDQSYNHWVINGVDFINLDNAENDAFDAKQLDWFDAVLAADLADASIRSVVVGMHDPLPHSLADDHSMCATTDGVRSGEHVYRRVAEAQAKKPVYLLASHQHYFLANVYDTAYWRRPGPHAGVVPGWIIGTAGAERYALPSGTSEGPDARQHVYGYLLGTVHADGRITFAFREVTESQLQAARGADYEPDVVQQCIANNPAPADMHPHKPKPTACDATP